jgi:hypothetical protein
LRDSIDIDDYNRRLFYFGAHIFVIVRNLKSKECDGIFKKTVADFATDYQQQRQLLDLFQNVYL